MASMNIVSQLAITNSVPFEEIRAVLPPFLKSFDVWLFKQKQAIVENRSSHSRTMTELRGSISHMQKELDTLKMCETEQMRSREQERKQRSALELDIEATRQRQTELESYLRDMDEEVSRTRAANQSIKQNLLRRRQESAEAEKTSIPELRAYETWLSYQITSLREDIVYFTWTHINPKRPDYVYTIALDVSLPRTYKVHECIPQLEGIQPLMDFLNETRDLFRFLKHVRRAFKDEARRGQLMFVRRESAILNENMLLL
ncbi:chromosome segregation protein Spc25-domain-containing protein [Cladochytrium replicatum]|nr:chromosome segregation protein Spc25-domain-containing protein [Cladochytrium replicatum]